jgi:HK97 family phage prohead protease
MKTQIEDRGAIPKHNTATSDKAWDGPANEAKLKTDQDYDYYRKAYAWRDPDGDEENKSSYKFIHHEISSDGVPGAANIRACQATIAVLNGARGGADIPDEDRQGVWNHVATHLKSADVEPAELKSLGQCEGPECPSREMRSFPFVEIRASEDGKKILGHAAVFGKLSEDLGGFREKVSPGAFLDTIDTDDIRALFNHDPNYVLGRVKSETLVLAEDKKGLAIDIIPPDTQWAKDLKESIKRGDITQMSFAFQAQEEEWDDEKKIRTLNKVRLFDVSVVTYPAYPQTDVKLRSLIDKLGKDKATEILSRSLDAENQSEGGTPAATPPETDNQASEKAEQEAMVQLTNQKHQTEIESI